MDARKQIFCPSCSGLAFVLVLIVANCGVAQNVYKDYVTDRNSQYSPFDHQKRGLIYRIQTGHAGFFGQCDDDRQKMISPYIDWHCRKKDPNLGLQFVQDFFGDTFRKSQRLADGAGACILGRCQQCEQCQQSVDNCQCQMANQSSAMRLPRTDLPRQSATQTSNRYEQQANQYARNVKAPVPPTRKRNVSPSSRSIAAGSRSAVQDLYGPSFDSYSNQKQNFSRAANLNPGTENRNRSNESSLAYFSERTSSTTHPTNRGSTRRGQPASDNGASLMKQEKQAAKSMIDPRFQKTTGLVPENHFAAIEKQFQSKEVRERKSQTQKNSTFQLSRGDGVYSRPVVAKKQSREPLIKSPRPGSDRQSDPRYFQFQQIGGSKYR